MELENCNENSKQINISGDDKQEEAYSIIYFQCKIEKLWTKN